MTDQPRTDDGGDGDDSVRLPGYAAHVFAAEEIWVVSGANQGDPIADAPYCEPGDIYHLDPAARAVRLMLAASPGGSPGGAPGPATQRLAPGTEIGQPGDEVALRALYTFVAPDGDRVEALLIVHPGLGAFVLPLSPISPRVDYTLIEARPDPGGVRVADIVCVSFAAGTMITLAGGAQRPIEVLRPGDLVLTRDNGAQPVRWIGHATLRAVGSFAPVVISAGTLGNAGDLILSPHHRVFLYQRGTRRAGGVAEILVQAKHLVDDEFVRRREGGFVDYFSLVFDRHEVIFAEGIAAESLMVNEATLTMLPERLSEEVRARFPGLNQRQHFGTEIGRRALEEFGREALFRFPKKD